MQWAEQGHVLRPDAARCFHRWCSGCRLLTLVKLEHSTHILLRGEINVPYESVAADGCHEVTAMANLETGNTAARPSGGPPKSSKDSPSGRPPVRPRSWWLIFLVLMMANYLLMPVLFPEPSSITIPYTFFNEAGHGGQCRDGLQCGRFDPR